MFPVFPLRMSQLDLHLQDVLATKNVDPETTDEEEPRQPRSQSESIGVTQVASIIELTISLTLL